MSDAAPPGQTRRRLLLAAPVVVAGAAGIGFLGMLRGMSRGQFDPHAVPNPLLGHPIPDFSLAAQPPGTGFDAAALRAAPGPVLVNFFASWCIPCVQEGPELAALRGRLPIWGAAYKDKVKEATRFVGETQNPYARIGRDADGRVAIDWGVYGVPESFLVSRGVVRWHFVGPIDPETARRDLLPLIARLG